MNRIQKLVCSLVALFISALAAHAQQGVSFSGGAKTVREAFSIIEQQTGMTVAYNEALLDVGKKIKLDGTKSVSEAMTEILDGSGLSFSIQGKIILIVKKDTTVTDNPTAVYSGTVKDALGPVPGAVVKAGDSATTVTDIDGKFSIKASKGSTLSVVMLGYKEYRKVLDAQTSALAIVLEEESTSLNEVVVVGYGTQKRVNLTGAIGTISGKDINQRPVTSAAQALQGADPSLLLTMGNGSIEGKEFSVQIRGQVSMNSGSPLILIDGVEGSLNQVNPNNIESISVLKDASACAIYGTTASAGVVLITTKSGTAGDLKVTYNGRAGIATNTTRTDFITCGYDYVMLSNEFTKHSPKGYNAWNYTDEEMQMLYDRRFDKTEHPDRPWVYKNESGKWRYLGNFDWYGYMFRRTRPETEHNVSISGGNDKINYYVSGRYLYRQGVFNAAAADDYNGYSFMAKVGAKVKPWLHYNGSVSLEGSKYSYGGYWEQDGSEGNNDNGILWNITQNISPTLVPVNPDGTIMMYTNGIQFADSPIASGRGGVFTDGRNKNARTNQYWIVSNKLTFNIIDGLKIVADYTYRTRNGIRTYLS